jgi:geranylgeranyl pyrophosphate synthase
MKPAATGRPGFGEYQAMLKDSLDAELETRLAQWFPDLPPAHVERLHGILAGGKRLRGCLACLVAEALGGRMERALPAALAIEVIQAASLVHDDFVDADVLRRGRAATWTWLTPRRAVLAADVLFATAIARMAEVGAAETATVARAIAAMASGAFQEMLDEQTAYRRIIQWKTGSLFAAAARLGALAADAAPLQIDAAHEFGARTGEAYQVADDLADVSQLCNGSRFAAQDVQRAAPALLYFGARTNAPFPAAALREEEAFREWFEAAAPRIRQDMCDEIDALAERARSALAPFPDNEHTRLLRGTPAEFARIMETA